MAVNITVIKTTEGVYTGKTEAEARSKSKKSSKSSSSPKPQQPQIDELPTSNLNSITPIARVNQTEESVKDLIRSPTITNEIKYTPYEKTPNKNSILQKAEQKTRIGSGETYTYYDNGIIERSNINPVAEIIRQGGKVETTTGEGNRPQITNILYSESATPIYEKSYTPANVSEANQIIGYSLAQPNTTVRGIVSTYKEDSNRKNNYIIKADKLKTEAQLNYETKPYQAYFQSAKGETGLFLGDNVRVFKETIKKPSVWAVATGVAVGGTLLATKNPVLASKVGMVIGGIAEIGLVTYLAFPRAEIKVGTNNYVIEGKLSQIGNKATRLGEVTGELSAYYVAGKVSQEITTQVVNSDLWINKKASIGGKSAKQRSGKKSKAEIRKQTYNANNNNKIFYDTQKKELGVKVINEGLKNQQFTKSRTIRVSTKPESFGHVTMIKDRLLGGRGSLTTDYLNKVNFGTQQPKTNFNKMYPKGYGSQSLSKSVSNVDQLQQYLIIQRSQATNIYTPIKKGNVPKITTGKNQIIINKNINPQNLVLNKNTPIDYTTKLATGQYIKTNVGGFRKGQADIIYKKLYSQKNLNEVGGFIKDLSGIENLPTFKGSNAIKNNFEIIQPTTYNKVELLTQPQSIISQNSNIDFKNFQQNKKEIFLNFNLAQNNKLAQSQLIATSTAFKLDEATEQQYKTISSNSSINYLKTKNQSKGYKTSLPKEIITQKPYNEKQFRNIIERKPKEDPKPDDPIIKIIDLFDPSKIKPSKSKNTFKNIKPTKQPTTYNPTVYSAITRLKASKIDKGGVATGLGVRPIVNERKKKKLRGFFDL